jgi:hypothetical protein
MAKKNITIGGEIKNAMMRDMVKALSTLGYFAMMDAYGKHSFTHRSRNLHDSYASAVYVNGELIENSIKYVGGVLSRKIDYTTHKTGRDTVNEYLHSHHFGAKNNEIVLVVIAAMFYAGILEDGDTNSSGRGPGQKYIVISPARDFIDRNYLSVLRPVYDKHGVKNKPKARVIKGEKLP